DASSPEAVEALRRWKGRDDQQPISILVSGADQLKSLGVNASTLARALIEAFWPGPLTLVLPTDPIKMTQDLALGIARRDGAVGFRCPQHPLAQSLVAAAETLGVGPLTATSLNRSGEPNVLDSEEAEQICKDSDGELFFLEMSQALGAGQGLEQGLGQGLEQGLEQPQGPAPEASNQASTVVDLCKDELVVLREGAVGHDELNLVLKSVSICE
ncbi:MAG: L-threonylcarbamoyladenylate synthase, partial [Deltaproteobacteria bacterium]|nr:L-threonylcarbamoyladenylate synthase [Deltaproteobacteria bacterium]